MIYARFLYDKRRRRARLELLGHAATAPRGQDLICAGVSALALTMGKSAQLLYSRGLLERPPKVRLENGDALIIASARPGCEAEMLMSFWTVQVGIANLSQLYPQALTLERVLRV